MRKIVANIPATGQAPTKGEDPARRKIIRQYRFLVRQKMGQIQGNAAAYVNKRAHSKSGVTVELRKILKLATFIPAHPTRFAVGGFVVEECKFFVLHRPGPKVKNARFDNIIREFVQPGRKASTHFVISDSGALVQMVDLADIAWHMGTKRSPLNSESVGVEIEGALHEPITAAALDALVGLIGVIAHISGMPLNTNTVLNHSTVLPDKKADAWITRRTRGNIEDSRLKQIISRAQQVKDNLTGTDYYKPPFDPKVDAAAKAGEIKALAATPGTTYLELSRLQAAGGDAAASARTTELATVDRAEVSTRASSHATGRVEQEGNKLATFEQDNNIQATPVPQTNNTGVLYDKNTGLTNDGEPL